ncbi:unnamed protein product [Lathyrus oleraceus]|uniref:DYW domain-containing protein n=2 Tax=Pisum sativum TaxID=3888 RepID=A0A9D5ANF9_PEA|nr:pentatricopeptide repeat-containing protein At4g32450, mitochondrial-like isoform X1 [Pisum sativum]XP_050884137.1 pentatricopeptide repeat-containing protein At4g32450, mitochondrial-like isoform X1 [Pisum sativum]XP_050884138.1 pentatricopeptide repeat-containing protein At4g32450, mitochondrial-like isoform X1 [Pisum sativum]KAI5413676.1 hypothetical protein KIW84_058011 [Pisum sativum]
MSSRKASVVTASSLLRLCNGCYMSRTICTAAERWDFQFSGGFKADASSGYQQNQAGFYQQNASGPYRINHASSEQISGQTAGGGHVNSTQNVVQNNLAEHNGSVNGDFVQSNLKMQHNVGVGVDNSRGFRMHPNTFEKHNWTPKSGEKVEFSNACRFPRPLEYQGHPKGNVTQNIGHFQQTPNDYYTSNERGQQNVTQNIGHFQQTPNDYYTRSNEMGQQYSAYGQSQQSVDGRHPPNFNSAHRSTVGSHLSSNPKPDGESVDAFSDSPYRGTLEELDSFCIEGKVKEAVDVLQVLEKLHIHVDLHRCLQLMHQCRKARSLEEAKVVHRHALQHLSPLNVSTCNEILEMYFECGSVDDAVKVFKNMTECDLTTWYTMITQLAKNGFAEDSIDIFTQFKSLGLKPDGQLFVGVFGACSMLGDIGEGMLHFESMSRDYGIVPTMAHYVSLVDMTGSIGHLGEALEFIEKMPMEPSVEVWETLMNSCRVHGNTELGDHCAELVEKLDPSRLNEKSKVGLLLEETSDSIKNKEQNNLASKNLLEVRSRIHEYRAGDTSHPENDKIYALLRGLRVQMKEAGYIAETKYVLHDIDQEGKEDALLAHSERLAVAYGLLNSSARSPIRVIKNLRVCGDCHTALKIISDLVGRELIIRDAKRFHHFKNGLCSCRDYW